MLMARCELCDDEFFRKNKNQRMCSAECRTKKNNANAQKRYIENKKTIEITTLNCLHCGKEFKKRENQVKKFCKHQCAMEFNSLKRKDLQEAAKKREFKTVKERFCKDCGILMTGKGKLPARCSECIELLYKRPVAKKVIPQQAKPKYTITEMAKMARDAGMTYGNYCELLRSEGVET